MTHKNMKRILNTVTSINLLLCLLICSLLCSCNKITEEGTHDGTNSTDAYLNLNLKFGTRADVSPRDPIEYRVVDLRVIVFDEAGKLETNQVFSSIVPTAENKYSVPIRVGIGPNKTIYIIANGAGEEHIDSGDLDTKLSSVTTQKEVEEMQITVQRLVASTMQKELLMLAKEIVDVKEGHSSTTNAQQVNCTMQRLSSKIALNARRESDMTVNVKSVKLTNLYGQEFLYSTAPEYKYPTTTTEDGTFLVFIPAQTVPESAEGVFTPIERYYVGTNYSVETSNYYSVEVKYDQLITGGTWQKNKTITIPFKGIAERNMAYTLNLNFTQTKVDVNLSVKNWDDEELGADIVPGAYLSLSESELTMYGPHKSTIGFQIDGTAIPTVEGNTDNGTPYSNYFTTIGVAGAPNTLGGTSGSIVLTPKTSGMSTTPGGETEVGLYVKSGNIRKLVKVKHINRDAYSVVYHAEGGKFFDGTDTYYAGSTNLGLPYDLITLDGPPTNNGRELLGWSFVSSALVPEFKHGARYTYEELGSPKDKVNLYAVWGDKAGISLLFSPNGKIVLSGMPGAITIASSGPVSIPRLTPATTGYDFAGWTVNPDGSGTVYGVDSEYNLTKTTTLYAKWTLKSVTMTLYPNNGVSDNVWATYSSADGPTFTITAANPSRSDYRFMGWNTRADGSGTHYDVNKPYTFPTTNTILYAEWQPLRKVRFVNSITRDEVRSTITNLVKGDKVDFSANYYWGAVPRYEQQFPHYYHPELRTYVNRYFEYWWDPVTSKRYDKRTAYIDMPDRDVVLEAKYTEVGSFPMWCHSGGTVYTHTISTTTPFDPVLRPISPSFAFGYWGRYHTLYYAKGRGFQLQIHSSWDWPPPIELQIMYKDGTKRVHRYGNEPVNQVRTWWLTADEVAKLREIIIQGI